MDRVALIPVAFVPLPGATIELRVADVGALEAFRGWMTHGRDVGFLFHDEERFGPFQVEIGAIGCAADIRAVYEEDDSEVRVVAVAHSRFEVVDRIEVAGPLPEAVVRPLEDSAAPPDEAIVAKREYAVSLFHTALRALPGTPRALPRIDCSEDVSFRLARFVGSSDAWKQQLLESRREEQRLQRLETSFLQAIARFQSPSLEREG